MIKKVVLLLLVATLLACKENPKESKESVNKNQIVSDSLTMELDEMYKHSELNGFGVAIVNGQGALYQRGFGMANVQNKKPYTASTVQNIASISKTVLGISLLKAQELGILNLDDPINNYLPFNVTNPKHPGKAITIRHLATHTSSINDTDDYDKSYILKDPIDPATESNQILEDFLSPDNAMEMPVFLEKYLSREGLWYQKDTFLDNEPGSFYSYSNIGATLAAYVLEEAANQSYKEFTKTHIFEPLGMFNTGWSFDAIDFQSHTKLYYNPQTEMPFYYLITYPDGGLLTSPNEISLYLSELILGYSGKGKLLSKESYQEFFTPRLNESHFTENIGYNYGIFIEYLEDGEIGHSGGDPGVSTLMYFNPETKIGRILFVNTDFVNDGYQQFQDIWNKLGAYTNRLDKLSK